MSHTSALKIVSVIQAQLEKERKGTAVAVVDTYSELLAFLRTDGYPLSSINSAINKAFTTTREGKESKAIGPASQTEPFL